MKTITLIAALLLGTAAKAQFFQGFGVMGGLTYSNQKWHYPELDQKQKLKYLLRWNAEVFAEFGAHPTFRWVTELQYNGKGAKMETPAGTTRFRNNYAAWNNYLMIRRELFSVIPYLKVGPRLEYVFKTDQQFTPFHATGSIGAGVEFVSFSRIKFLTEFHYVPDLTRSFSNDLVTIKQPAFELRVGIKFGKPGNATCPGLQ
ncbi:MAG: porin family protein [Bacteroidia bacterium]|nr:porin family protein [Bacteroidia bacterium]